MSLSAFAATPRARRALYLRDLLRELVARDLKLRYKRSVLGILWSLVNPVVQMLVFLFLFRIVVPLDVPKYPAFVFSGVLIWSWFQSAIVLAASVITDNRELIRRPGFPVAVLPTVTVTTQLIYFLLALPVLLVFILLSGGSLTFALLALPFLLGLQFVLTLSLAYLVAALQVPFRDTQHIISLLMLMLFYLTPVFYNASAVPENYRWLYNLNPMVELLGAYRAILLDGLLPTPAVLLWPGILALVLIWLGYGVFTRASYQFAEEL